MAYCFAGFSDLAGKELSAPSAWVVERDGRRTMAAGFTLALNVQPMTFNC